MVHTPDNSHYVEGGPCGHAGIPQVAVDYPFVSDTDTAMAVLMIPFALVMGALSLRRLLAGRHPAAGGERSK
jgi:hypothetical protein